MKRLLSVLLLAVLMVVAVPLGSVAAEINPALASYYCGDADGDWSVTTADARDILVASLTDSDLTAYPRYDVNADGALTSADARDVLINVVNGVTPTLISPAVTKIDTLPEGEEVVFTELPKPTSIRITEDYKECTFLVVQSPEEFQAIYTADCVTGSNYADGYDDVYFADHSIVLVKIFMLEYPEDVQVIGLYREGTTLIVYVVEEFGRGVLPATWGTRTLLEIPKSELNGITDLQMIVVENRLPFE